MAGVRVTPADDLADSERLTALHDDPPTVEMAAPGSLLDRLRSRAADSRARTLDIPVPGRWRGDLVLRFRPLGVGQLERFVEGRRAGTSGTSESIEVMATCCVGVYGRDGDRLVEIPDEDGRPLRISHALGVTLGMAAPYGATLTTREVVVWLFEDNAFALGAVVDRLVEWAADPDASEPAGES